VRDPLDWPDEGERQALGLESETELKWRARELERAPAREPEHWLNLARAAGVSASQSRPAQAETPSDHDGPALP